VSRPAPSSRPRLARGCRISEQAGQESTLLMPEGAMRLNPPGLKILRQCDGQHTFAEIVSVLQGEFAAPPERVAEDTAVFLEHLQERRAVDYE
jgi:pyrroloquinoline quinone biosynthesis protein D